MAYPMNIQHLFRLSALAALVLTACTSENTLPSAVQSESVQAYVADNYPDVAIDNIAVASVPEPETYTLLLAGLAAIGGIALRRKPY
jgi:hypothetical protein